jgi:hypothetical protein
MIGTIVRFCTRTALWGGLFAAGYPAASILSASLSGDRGRLPGANQTQAGIMPIAVDTTVRVAGAPRHAGLGRLEETLSIGVVAGDPNYEFGLITDLLVAKDSSLWVLEGGALAAGSGRLRRYSQSGRFLGAVGRSGSGPGEFFAPASLAQLPDSRVLVRDNLPALSLLVYSPAGASIGKWTLGRLPGMVNSPAELSVDMTGVVYVEVLMAETGVRGSTPSRMRTTTIRMSSNGTAFDTVPPPAISNKQTPEIASVSGRGAANTARSLPYAPGKFWVWSRGNLITAFADRYAFEIIQPAQVGAPGTSSARRWLPATTIVSVRREVPPVLIGADEGESLGGRLAPGQVVPREKPAFRGIEAGSGGEILVMASVPSERVAASSAPDAGGRAAASPTYTWREPIVFDIFSSNGVYDGRIRLPNGARYMDLVGDQLWCVVRGDSGVDVVKRYTIRW